MVHCEDSLKSGDRYLEGEAMSGDEDDVVRETYSKTYKHRGLSSVTHVVAERHYLHKTIDAEELNAMAAKLGIQQIQNPGSPISTDSMIVKVYLSDGNVYFLQENAEKGRKHVGMPTVPMYVGVTYNECIYQDTNSGLAWNYYEISGASVGTGTLVQIGVVYTQNYGPEGALCAFAIPFTQHREFSGDNVAL